MTNVKDEVIAAIKKLPSDADIADIMAEVYSIQRMQLTAGKPQIPKVMTVPEPRRPGRPRKLQ